MENRNINLIEKLCKKYDLDENQGYANTLVDEIKIFKISCDEQMMPLLFNKGLIFLFKGKKISIINNKTIENTVEDYGIISTPQPIECESCILQGDSIVGLYVNLNMNRLQKVVSIYNELNANSNLGKKTPHSFAVQKRTIQINEVISRILNTLDNELDSLLLSSALLDELLLRVLQNENGFILQELCEHSSSFSKISKVIEFLHNNYNQKISIEEMAQMANMSANNFHRLFKEATSDTPIQFIKKIRLGRARELILHKNMKAVNASDAVGYDSATQFSREFKRYFGVTPSKIGELGYKSF